MHSNTLSINNSDFTSVGSLWCLRKSNNDAEQQTKGICITKASNVYRRQLRWRLEYPESIHRALLSSEKAESLDNYDLGVLSVIIDTCTKSTSMADAGRKLFNVSRTAKASSNDSHRLKQILDKYGLVFEKIKASIKIKTTIGQI